MDPATLAAMAANLEVCARIRIARVHFWCASRSASLAVPELTQITAIQLNGRVSLRPRIDVLTSRCRAQTGRKLPTQSPSAGKARQEAAGTSHARRPHFSVGLRKDDARTPLQFYLWARVDCRSGGVALVPVRLRRLDLQALTTRAGPRFIGLERKSRAALASMSGPRCAGVATT
jgi:hypothetical protein